MFAGSNCRTYHLWELGAQDTLECYCIPPRSIQYTDLDTCARVGLDHLYAIAIESVEIRTEIRLSL